MNGKNNISEVLKQVEMESGKYLMMRNIKKYLRTMGKFIIILRNIILIQTEKPDATYVGRI